MSDGCELVGVVLPRRVWCRIATRLRDIENLLRRFGRTQTAEAETIRQLRTAADLASVSGGEDVTLL